jgi:hypothetical protein
MGLFKKKSDPLSDRARALNQEIAQLEAQIKKLDSRMQKDDSQPRLRSTALPHGTTVSHQNDADPAPPAASPQEPIFEEIDRDRLKPPAAASEETPQHFNDLGMRKYDLAALFKRWRNHFQGPSTTNPRLVSYLAAGGIQGLRPLRYEKRVARNRFIALVIVLFLTLLGIVAVFLKTH